MSTITSTIEAITANTRKFVEQQNKAATSARNLTWTIMAEVYALGLEAFKAENAVDFDRELHAHGLNPAKEGENPWLKVINVAVGDFYINAKKKRKWRPNVSFSKYARALRYMQGQGVTAEGARDYIRNPRSYTDAKGIQGKHLIGMIAADKIVNPGLKRDMTDKKAMDIVLACPPLGAVAIPGTEGWVPKYARAYGEFRDGVFILRGLIADSEDAAKQDLNKAGKALLAKGAS